MKRKFVLVATTLCLFSAYSGITAFAAEQHSYLDGQQRSRNRIEIYAESENFTTEEQRQAFLISHSIADTEYSEENAAHYSYLNAQNKNIDNENDSDIMDNTQKDGYSYMKGQERGSSYRQ